MTFEIIIQIILYGIALSMDAFAASITYSLCYQGIDKKKAFIIAITFGVFQALMPLISYWLIEGVAAIAGADRSEQVGKTLGLTVTWAAFGLLLFIGAKMIFEGIKKLKTPDELKVEKLFSCRELILLGVATSIDALAVGVSLHSGTLSNNATIWLHTSMIMVITFGLSLVGVLLGKVIAKLLKGKYEISSIVGGTILVLLAVWVVVSHYTGL